MSKKELSQIAKNNNIKYFVKGPKAELIDIC